MTLARDKRDPKRQLGQFLTPPALADHLVVELAFARAHKVLEPSLGDGSFVLPLIERFMGFYQAPGHKHYASKPVAVVLGLNHDRNP